VIFLDPLKNAQAVCLSRQVWLCNDGVMSVATGFHCKDQEDGRVLDITRRDNVIYDVRQMNGSSNERINQTVPGQLLPMNKPIQKINR
jgi:hypothetical protein